MNLVETAKSIPRQLPSTLSSVASSVSEHGSKTKEWLQVVGLLDRNDGVDSNNNTNIRNVDGTEQNPIDLDGPVGSICTFIEEDQDVIIIIQGNHNILFIFC